jgi:hypothetical protein
LSRSGSVGDHRSDRRRYSCRLLSTAAAREGVGLGAGLLDSGYASSLSRTPCTSCRVHVSGRRPGGREEGGDVLRRNVGFSVPSRAS